MKYKVRVSELRYGEVEVDAESEEAAKTIATGRDALPLNAARDGNRPAERQ